MTCIVAYKDENGKIYMGGDSAGVSGLNISIRKDVKVFKREDIIFGYTSSFRMGQILRYDLKLPKQKCEDDYEYMCTDFINSVRACFKDKGYAQIINGEDNGGCFLVGYKGNIYIIDDDFQVGMFYDNHASVGCGESYALGALEAMKDTDKTPEEVITKALSIAAHYSGGVRPPFIIEK